MSKTCNKFLFIFFLLLFDSFSAQSDVKLPALISDNMVLQRDMNVRIWGWAESVVHFDDLMHSVLSS